MMSGAIMGGGGGRLRAHLADHKRHNVRTMLVSTRLVDGASIEDALRDLEDTSRHGRTRKTVYHEHMDPGPYEQWSDVVWADAWGRTEAALGFQDVPFVEVEHWTWRTLEVRQPDLDDPERDNIAPVEVIDIDRLVAIHSAANVKSVVDDATGAESVQVLMAHRHRVYSRVRDDGSVIPCRNDYYIRQRVSREIEHDYDFQLQRSAHSLAVIKALRSPEIGRPDIAAAMEMAGLHDGPRPIAETPEQRLIRERLAVRVTKGLPVDNSGRPNGDRDSADWPHADLDAHLVAAWKSGARGADLTSQFQRGRTLVEGSQCSCVLDEHGAPRPLLRMLNTALRDHGEKAIKEVDLSARLDGVVLPTVEQARQSRIDFAAGALAAIAQFNRKKQRSAAGYAQQRKAITDPSPTAIIHTTTENGHGVDGRADISDTEREGGRDSGRSRQGAIGTGRANTGARAAALHYVTRTHQALGVGPPPDEKQAIETARGEKAAVAAEQTWHEAILVDAGSSLTTALDFGWLKTADAERWVDGLAARYGDQFNAVAAEMGGWASGMMATEPIAQTSYAVEQKRLEVEADKAFDAENAIITKAPDSENLDSSFPFTVPIRSPFSPLPTEIVDVDAAILASLTPRQISAEAYVTPKTGGEPSIGSSPPRAATGKGALLEAHWL